MRASGVLAIDSGRARLPGLLLGATGGLLEARKSPDRPLRGKRIDGAGGFMYLIRRVRSKQSRQLDGTILLQTIQVLNSSNHQRW